MPMESNHRKGDRPPCPAYAFRAGVSLGRTPTNTFIRWKQYPFGERAQDVRYLLWVCYLNYASGVSREYLEFARGLMSKGSL